MSRGATAVEDCPHFLKVLNTELPDDPAPQRLDVYPKESIGGSATELCAPVFTAARFTRSRKAEAAQHPWTDLWSSEPRRILPCHRDLCAQPRRRQKAPGFCEEGAHCPELLGFPHHGDDVRGQQSVSPGRNLLTWPWGPWGYRGPVWGRRSPAAICTASLLAKWQASGDSGGTEAVTVWAQDKVTLRGGKSSDCHLGVLRPPQQKPRPVAGMQALDPPSAGGCRPRAGWAPRSQTLPTSHRVLTWPRARSLCPSWSGNEPCGEGATPWPRPGLVTAIGALLGTHTLNLRTQVLSPNTGGFDLHWATPAVAGGSASALGLQPRAQPCGPSSPRIPPCPAGGQQSGRKGYLHDT